MGPPLLAAGGGGDGSEGDGSGGDGSGADGSGAAGAGAADAVACSSAVAGAGSGSTRSVAALASAPSIVISAEPSETLSPTETTTSLTTPAIGAGTSMVALSDSSVTSGSSTDTVSPAETRISMIGTSLKSPMSGTSIVWTVVLIGSDAGRHRGLGVDLVLGDRIGE